MFDRDSTLELLRRAESKLNAAQNALEAIKKEGGEVVDLRAKRRAVKKELEDLAEALEAATGLVAAAEPPAEPAEPEEPVDDEEPAPGDEQPLPEEPVETEDLFSLEDQHAVSKLMQDSGVHLAVRHDRDFWEIRHRNTADGRASDPIRAKTIAEAYARYEAEAVRKGSFRSPEPRALSAEEQRALHDFRELRIDNPRSVRWEKTKTEVDFIDVAGNHAGGNTDAVEFPAGELIGPVEYLKSQLG